MATRHNAAATAHPPTASRILIVDDTPQNIQVLGTILRQEGYQLNVARNGLQALDIVAATPPDLILLDVMMPELDGFETCQRLKADPTTQDIPVIFLTARVETDDIVQGFQLGAVDYVTKPFNPTELLVRVDTHLSLHHLRQDLAAKNRQLDDQNHELDAANRFIRQTFGRYISDEVVDSLLDSPGGLQMGGELRQVTILMSDLRGFSALSETLSPTQVIEFLNRYLGIMVDVILHYQGTIDEIIGDGLLVIFGSPMQIEDHAERAVACGVAMQLAMADVNTANCQAGLPEVEMGIGIHTGQVVVGNIGSHKRTKYGVVGSPVNLTGRIESYTVGGQILVSESTRQSLRVPLRVDSELAIEPKGAQGKLAIYEVGGIGGAYDLHLPQAEEALVDVSPGMAVQFSILEEKFVGRTVFDGQLTRLSAKEGVIESDQAVAPLSNVKVWLREVPGEDITGELYGKVLERDGYPENRFLVRFTSVPPGVRTWLASVLPSAPSG